MLFTNLQFVISANPTELVRFRQPIDRAPAKRTSPGFRCTDTAYDAVLLLFSNVQLEKVMLTLWKFMIPV